MLNKFLMYLFIGYISLGFLRGQNKENETIGVQEVLVVKSYTPSLSDAFKINSSPKLPDSIVSKKSELKYQFKEVLVVSTFQPIKATPLKLKQKKPAPPQNSLFSGAMGNQKQLFLNISSVVELDRAQRFGLNFYKDGYGKDLPNTLLKSNEQYSRFGLNHNFRSSEYNANTQFQFKRNLSNYYGLYDQTWDSLLINSIDPEIKRSKLKLRTHWNWYDFIVRGLSFQANLTTDNFKTTEQQLAIQTDLEFKLDKGKIKTEILLEGFTTQFATSYYDNSMEEYRQGQGVLNLFWSDNSSDLKFKIGAGVSYVLGMQAFSKPLQYYPKIEILYQKPKSTLNPYLLANGGVQLNTYNALSEINPYLAPTTFLQPTFNRYNATLGVRSQLASVLNFDLGLVYDQVENFSFFTRLPFDGQNDLLPYKLSNAFEGSYTDLDFYGLNASLKIDFAKNNYIRLDTEYRIYEPQGLEDLWNVPQLEFRWDSQFLWKKNLVFSFNGIVWGNRITAQRPMFFNQTPLKNTLIISGNLPLFFRSTAHLTYKIAPQFDLFIKSRFSSKGKHGRWAYYPDPSLLLIGGVTYKFDFQY